jgi:hypothetical protein
MVAGAADEPDENPLGRTAMEDFDPDLDFEVQQHVVAVLEIDPVKFQHYIDLRRTHQHLPMALTAGIVGAIIGALAWVGITMFTGMQVGWMATATGVIVGGMVRISGHGYDREFGLTAVMLTLVASAVGMLLAGCWLVSLESEEAAFADLLFALTPGLVSQIFHVMLTPLNLVYCGGGTAVAYWFGIRRIQRDELAKCAIDQKKAQRQASSWAA